MKAIRKGLGFTLCEMHLKLYRYRKMSYQFLPPKTLFAAAFLDLFSSKLNVKPELNLEKCLWCGTEETPQS